MAIAFFDFDKTLIARNSATLWVRYELRNGIITRKQAMHALLWVARYHLGSVDIADAYRRGIASLAGRSEEVLRYRTNHFYREEIANLYRAGARRALAEHRRQGHRLVILTSSSEYLAEAARSDLGLDDAISTRFEVDDEGRFTGAPVEPLCFGHGKRQLAERYAKARNIALSDCAFYSDSMSDLPVLDVVGKPVAVNPDPRLRRLARKRGWPIDDWGGASPWTHSDSESVLSP